MQLDLQYRIENTPLSPARRHLYPLFEAIANSIHAIEETGRSDGLVTIELLRENPATTAELTSEAPLLDAVIGFTVEDNGIGFTDDNFQSFETAHSGRKRDRGGKGVGRLLWLKAFEHAEVDSVYKENGHFKRRQFEFSLSHKGIGNVRCNRLKEGNPGTRVSLVNYLPEYGLRCSPRIEVIARRIISHFIGQLLFGNCPQIVIKDERDTINLNREFKEKMQLSVKTTKVTIEGHRFKIDHLRLVAASQTGHEMHFCTSGRAVETEDLQEHIPSLRGPLMGEDGQPFYYTACVFSPLFDSTVDWGRTRFEIADQRELKGQPLLDDKEVSRQEVWKKVAEQADKFLSQYLAPVRDRNTERIVRYIQTKEPKYRPLAKHRKKWFDRIAANISDEALSVELYKLSREYEKETQVTMRAVKRSIEQPDRYAAHRDKFKEFLTEINDQAIASLADYVVHRRAILDFLKESIKQLPDGRYVAEKHIHEIICPLGTTSDDVPLDQMNLWIIDERLAYHHYLSSDRQQRSVEPLAGASDNRADIILFNHAVAFADQEFGSIVIIEFKRPMRDDYTEEENPIAQVYRYAEEIRSGKVKSRSGRPVPATTPMYAYVICDHTPNLRKFTTMGEFQLLPDLQGYFKYHSVLMLYTEVITFDKLLKDAEQRNTAYFDRLRLPVSDSGH